MSLYIGDTFIPALTLTVSGSGSGGNYQSKIVNPSVSLQNITPDNGYDALSDVTINAIQTETRNITSNGTFIPSAGKFFSSVTVNVSGSGGTTINNQNKTITPTTAQQIITADSGYTGLGTVTINRIPTEYLIPTGNKTITANGTNIDVAEYATVSVNVATGGTAPTIESLTVTPNESIQTFNSASLDGYKPVTVEAISSTYVGSEIAQRTSADLSGIITSNPYAYTITAPAGYYNNTATYAITAYDLNGPTISVNTTTGLITATASIASNKNGYYTTQSAPRTLQLTTQNGSTIMPTESEQTAVAANVYTLGAVKIGAISSTYVGSGITTRSSSDLTVSNATVTVPAGYYAEAASKSVATMTLPTAASSSATTGYTRKATINRSTSIQYINIPPGYNSSGAYYQITATPNGTVTAPSSISGTTATVSTGTNTLTLTETISVTPNVTTAGYISAGTAGNASVSLTASVTTKAAATYNVSTSNQTIAARTYLTGAQTIRAVTHTATADKIAAGQTIAIGDAGNATRIANLTGTFSSDATAAAADILNAKTAYVNGVKLSGALVVQNFYTGSSAPASSLGNNGDIYLQS